MNNIFFKKKIFFSLTWKALFAVTISTLLASGTIYILGNYTYERNHAQKRIVRHRYYKQAFESVLRQLQYKETELSWLIPALITDDVGVSKELSNIKELIDSNWFRIELESDIRSIYLFSLTGKLKGEWGESLINQSFSSDWIGKVIKEEQPLSKIVCDNECIQYHILPFLYRGKFTGIFVFVSGITDIVLQMKGITGADIGLLVRKKEGSSDLRPILKQWSLQIGALTSFSDNQALLFALQDSFPDSMPDQSISYYYNNNTYDIFSIPFGEKPNQAKLVVIDNISLELLEKDRAVKLYITSGLSTIILSAAILFFLFVRPTRKLNKIISLLPFIADKHYSKVEQSLPASDKTKLFTDEVDVLDSAAHNLIETLTRLDNEVEQRNRRLLERSKELQNERNFVSNILNIAQVVIMRLDRYGEILSINKFGETLTGYYGPDLIKQRMFIDLLCDNESYESIKRAIPELLNKKYSTFQYDCRLYSLEGVKLYLSWYFTLINNPDTQPEVLVVGLDLTERKQVETQLAWLADHDPLTRLFNRRRFEIEFRRVLKESERFNQSGALIFFDIDQFKYINDSSGHQAGDHLLLKVAEKLRSVVRCTDIVARLGGDEFVVLAPKINQQQAEILINKIFMQLQQVDILFQGNLHRVSISAGLLIFPVKGYGEQDLMASVDIAMYKAKESGRGNWCLASIDDLNREDIKQRVNWKAKIERALAEDRFVLYFQPILKISDNSISHYECLLRMIDEKGDVIPPGLFIYVAEQTGLINQIDRRVIELAIAAHEGFISQGLDITLSVNLSGDMVSNEAAFKIFQELFVDASISLEKFIFEITETQAVTNLLAAKNFITQVIELGGTFALDDFGVGFSSMNHLKKLPVKYLKIDGEFIKNLATSKEDALFVCAIREVAHGLNIKTIAEFVEDTDVLEKLAEIGIQYAQGYGVGKPMPYPAFHQTDEGSNEQ